MSRGFAAKPEGKGEQDGGRPSGQPRWSPLGEVGRAYVALPRVGLKFGTQGGNACLGSRLGEVALRDLSELGRLGQGLCFAQRPGCRGGHLGREGSGVNRLPLRSGRLLAFALATLGLALLQGCFSSPEGLESKTASPAALATPKPRARRATSLPTPDHVPPAAKPGPAKAWRTPCQAQRTAARGARARFEGLWRRGEVLRRVEGCGQRVALTFDDGPSPVTPKVLAILARHRARATFFVVGRRIPRYQRAVRAMLAQGHQVENHTWSHELGPPYSKACFVTASAPHQRQELLQTDAALGYATRFVRVPGGLFTRRGSAASVAHALHKVVVNWDVSGDTPGVGFLAAGRVPGKTPEDFLHHYLQGVHAGSIVLLHPENRYDAPYTLVFLERLIVTLQRRGYRLVTLDQLLASGP